METKKFIKIEFEVADIKEMKPNWSDKRCAEFLEKHDRYVKALAIEFIFELLEDIINLTEKGEK